MGGKSSAPAPDYAGAAQQTAAGNKENLIYQTEANRPNMITPWGQSNWDSGADGNSWTNTVTLSPDQQQALDAQLGVQNNQSQLARTLQGQTAATMAGGFNAPQLGTYTNGVPSVNSNFQGFSPNGVGGVNQQTYNPQAFTGGNFDVNQTFTDNTGGVNLNAPQFSNANSQAGAQAAFNAQTELLNDGWEQDNKALESKLLMQGLTPGSEAFDNAMQNQLRVQGQQKNQIANQSVLTGNEMANRDYSSVLAGYGAQLGAQGQQFGQNATSFGLTNDARTQNLGNDLSLFGATLQGQGAGNAATGQAFQQSLAGYGANQGAQQLSNAAQQQTYDQAMQNYRTNYESQYQQYMMPLNSMNAVLTGQQVQNPTFNSFGQSGYVPGADYSGAASALGQWNSGQAAQNNGMFSSLLGTAGTLGSAFLMASDARLKTNIKRIGTTEGGHNWYEWSWRDGSGKSRGVMAQEIVVTNPEAVLVGNDGYYRVNYAAIA